MSGSYNTANLEVNVSSKYQSQQYLRSAAVTSIVHDTLPIEISYLQSQQQLETHHHMTTINVPRATLTSIFKDHMHAVNGFKEYLSETAIVSNDSVAERCLKSPVTNAATHSNKILITNNFAPQQKPVVLQSNQYLREQSERAVHSGNLRLLSASEISALHPSCVYNINSTMNKDLSKDKFLHLQQFTTPQKQFCQQKKQLLAHPAHFVTQQQVLHVQSTRPSHYVQSQFSQQQHSLHQFYSPSEDDTNRCTTNGKVLPITNTISTIVPNPTVCAVSTSATNSTVVLDRINICINNHRMNDGTVASTAASPTSTTISTIPPRQLSPIIPEIEHKAVAKSESGPVIDLHASNDSINTVIDEPDSTTTTPHTPPTTPKNVQVIDTASAANVYSPTRKTLTKCFTVTVSGENVKAAKAKQNLIEASTYQNLSKAQKFFQQQIANNGIQVKDQIKTKNHREIQTIQDIFVAQTPTTPSESAKFTFAIGEDVLVKRADTRFYLGTIIKTDSQKLLVRFDDNSELWTTVDEIRKLCGGKNSQKGQMCVSCKKCVIAEVVEICERCGRGYHRSCTNETSSGSGYWMCKRCEKPMKILETSISLDQRMKSLCQLPYDVISTTTINPIPTNFIPVYAKDSNSAPRNHKRDPSSQQINTDSSNNNNLPSAHFPASQSNTDFVSLAATSTSQATKPTYGRRLRQRPEKLSLYASRRGSISGVSTSSNSSTLSTGAAVVPRTCAYILDLKQSVTKYFGAANRIESGEIFSIRAKRRLADGQMQYLIEWGTDVPTS